MPSIPGFNDISKVIPQPVKSTMKMGVNTTYKVIDGLDRVVAKSPDALLDFMCLTSYLAETAMKSAYCNPKLCQSISNRALHNVDYIGSLATFSGVKFFLSGDWRSEDWVEISRKVCSTTSGVAMAALWTLEQRLVDVGAVAAKVAQYPLVGRVTVVGVRQFARSLSVVSIFIQIYQIGNPMKIGFKDKEKMLLLASCVVSVSLKVFVIAGLANPAAILALSVASTGLSLGHFLYADDTPPSTSSEAASTAAPGLLGNRVVKVVTGTAEGAADMLGSVGSFDKVTKLAGAIAGAVALTGWPGAQTASAVNNLIRSGGSWFKLGKATTAWKAWAGRVQHYSDPNSLDQAPEAQSTWTKVQNVALTVTASLDVVSFSKDLGLIALGSFPLKPIHFACTAIGLGTMGVRVWYNKKLSTKEKAIKSADCAMKVALSGLALATLAQTPVFAGIAVASGAAGVYMECSNRYGWNKTS